VEAAGRVALQMSALRPDALLSWLRRLKTMVICRFRRLRRALFAARIGRRFEFAAPCASKHFPARFH
jgi:hypothetical protein